MPERRARPAVGKSLANVGRWFPLFPGFGRCGSARSRTWTPAPLTSRARPCWVRSRSRRRTSPLRAGLICSGQGTRVALRVIRDGGPGRSRAATGRCSARDRGSSCAVCLQEGPSLRPGHEPAAFSVRVVEALVQPIKRRLEFPALQSAINLQSESANGNRPSL